MKYKFVAWSFVLLAGLVLLAGCGKAEEEGPVRIRIWHQKADAERVLFNQIVEEYNATHPDRKVEVLYRETEELRNLFVIAAIAGKGPDIVYGPSDNIGLFVTTETILPLDTIFDADFLNRFTPDGRVAWKEHVWMLADQVGNHLALVYNQDLVAVPPDTSDELIALGKQLTRDTNGDGRPDQYALVWTYTEPFFFIPFLTGFGGWVMDEEGNPTLDTPETVRAIQFILDLRDKYRIIPRESDYNVAETLFKEGRAAMIINGPWAWSGYGKAGVPYMIHTLPVIKETGLHCAPMVSSKGYSINANIDPRKVDLAREVIAYLTSAEVQHRMAMELATIPVLPEVLEMPDIQANPILQVSIKQARLGKPMPIVPQMRMIWDGMRGPYQLVMNGAISAEEGARLMQKQAEKLIAEMFL